mgnify:CR=1 FL=1
MIRAFAAVKIDCTPPLRRIVGRLSRMGRALKPVSPNGLHVTLKFFGDVEWNSTAGISRVLEEIASPFAPFTLQVRGLGAFPRPERPSVVWAGLADAEPLIELAGRLEPEFENLGFPAERRPFHPHLTLARVKSRPPDELFAMLTELAAAEFGSARVDAVELLQSEVRADGPVYTTLCRVELAGSSENATGE